MSEADKYVIQLEHENALNEQGSNLVYMIKDRALTKRVDAIDMLLQHYNGLCGGTVKSEANSQETTVDYEFGILDSDWIDTGALKGLYIVTDIGEEVFETTSYNDETTRHEGDWDEININNLDVLVKIINSESQVAENLNYINNDDTAASAVICPAILIISEDENNTIQAATLIDANGVIWRRVALQNTEGNSNYKWVNLWDNKANISDFKQACAIIDLQSQAIANLQATLNNIQDQLKDLQSLKSLADILSASVDIEGTFDDVLVIGNDIDYIVNNNEYLVADVLKKYLRTNGDVVWLQTQSTLEALQYFYPVVDENGETNYPSFIPRVNSKVRFNQYASGTSYSIKDFEVVIILLNRNDLYNTTDYSGSTFAARMGAYNAQSSVTTIRTNDAIVYYKNSELPNGTTGDDSDSSYIKYVPVTISLRTICDAILGLVKLIKQDTAQDGKSSAKIRIATPITWVRNNTTDMTTVQKNNMTSLINEIKDKLCPTEGVPFISTDMIMNDAKAVELTDNGNARIKTTIDAYISQLSKSIEAGTAQQVTYNFDTSPQSMTSILKKPTAVSTKTFTITPGVQNKLGIRFSSTPNPQINGDYIRSETKNATWASTQQDPTASTPIHAEVGYRKNNGNQQSIGAFYATGGWKSNATTTIECGSNDTIEFIIHGYATWTTSHTINLAAGGTKTITITAPNDSKVTFYWKLEFYDAST